MSDTNKLGIFEGEEKKGSKFSRVVRSVKRMATKQSKNDVEKKYKFGRELGTGNFAVVHLAEDRKTRKKYAIKVINKSLCSGKEDMIETEINILKQVRHRYIVGMRECFDTPDRLYLVLDFVSGGELFDRIVEEGNFTEADASRIAKQMTEAIQYLHEHDIVHRDLKPENLLFRDKSSSSDVLVTDFGLSKLLNDNVALKTACGTPNYVAPEILMQRGYGKQVDIWSLGVILFIILCGYPPFYNENDAALFELIMKGQFSFDERYWKDISKEAKHLISMMLTVDPVKRYDTYQVLSHPWITGEANIPNVNLSKSISMNLVKTGLGQLKEEDEHEDEEEEEEEEGEHEEEQEDYDDEDEDEDDEDEDEETEASNDHEADSQISDLLQANNNKTSTSQRISKKSSNSSSNSPLQHPRRRARSPQHQRQKRFPPNFKNVTRRSTSPSNGSQSTTPTSTRRKPRDIKSNLAKVPQGKTTVV